jgi:hypothetical protein
LHSVQEDEITIPDVEPAAFLALLRFLYRFARLVPFFAALLKWRCSSVSLTHFLVPFFAVLGEMALLFRVSIFFAFFTVSLGPWFQVSPFPGECNCDL